jgi:hypothetical protein
VETDAGECYSSPLVVAADGAKSEWRQFLNIPMQGQPTLQHLINVHVTIIEDDTSQGRSSSIPPAMLYTLLSPMPLMMVRHAPNDYVLQIPYFPPYQSMQEDFSLQKVETILTQALPTSTNFEIQSIQPWTMGSLVAQDYVQQKVFLVGDAAHVFPPAGGLGMNTGLQDAFGLAWRLALFIKKQKDGDDDKDDTASIDGIGRLHQSERQPIAHQNAALSVRNYQRVLNVMKACYLYPQHPQLALHGLDFLGKTFGVPFRYRRQGFQSLLQTALEWPPLLQTRIASNLRALLQSGQGLPLLFPNHEVGFRYGNDDDDAKANDDDNDTDWTKDTLAKPPQLAKGALFPHLEVQVQQEPSLTTLALFPRLCWLDPGRKTITTRDLPAQLSTTDHPCTFVGLHILRHKKHLSTATVDITEICQRLQEELSIPCSAVQLTTTAGSTTTNTHTSHHPHCLNLNVDQWPEWLDDEEDVVVVIRPDGHVASSVSTTSNPADDIFDKLLQDTRRVLF